MTPQKAINYLTFIRNAYQNLNENGADEFRIIGKGVNATVEYSKSSYSEYVVALDLAISTLEKQIPKKTIDKSRATDDFFGNCPCCNRIVNDRTHSKRCNECGQVLDWSDTMIPLKDEQEKDKQHKEFKEVSFTNMLDYQSPITVVMTEMRYELENNVFKAVQNVGIDVDKDELIKALEYDRGQYEKGYKCAEEQFGKYARWNDCNDRLPEDEQRVLVQTSQERIQLARFFEDSNRWVNDHGLDICPQMIKYWAEVLPLNPDED